MSDDTESILYDVLRILRELKVNINKLPLDELRVIIDTYNDDCTKTRKLIEISMSIYDKYIGSNVPIPPISISNIITPVDLSFFQQSDPYSLTRSINPRNLYRKAYVGLDGMKSTISYDHYKISWELNNVFNLIGAQVKNTFKNIVAIKLLSYNITLTISNANSTNITTVLIDEFDSQCFRNDERKFHFISYDTWKVGDDPTSHKMIVDKSCQDGIFMFNPPIKLADSITMSFGRPTRLIPIPDQIASPVGVPTFINLEVTYIDPVFEYD